MIEKNFHVGIYAVSMKTFGTAFRTILLHHIWVPFRESCRQRIRDRKKKKNSSYEPDELSSLIVLQEGGQKPVHIRSSSSWMNMKLYRWLISTQETDL